MGWIDDLEGTTVGIDSASLIYYIEENESYLPLVDAFFDALDGGEFRVVTSTVTLLEVLVYPFREGNADLAQQYRDILFQTQGLTMQVLTPEIAEIAAGLRAEYTLRLLMPSNWQLRYMAEVLAS